MANKNPPENFKGTRMVGAEPLGKAISFRLPIALEAEFLAQIPARERQQFLRNAIAEALKSDRVA